MGGYEIVSNSAVMILVILPAIDDIDKIPLPVAVDNPAKQCAWNSRWPIFCQTPETKVSRGLPCECTPGFSAEEPAAPGWGSGPGAAGTAHEAQCAVSQS
jgi:hypothetical protein